MIHVEVWHAAKDDLVEIQKVDRIAAIRLAAVIEQMASDEDLQEILLTHTGTSAKPRVEVKKWKEQYKQGKNLWRLKVWYAQEYRYALGYRIVYAYKPRDLATRSPPLLIVLGVVTKGEFNYGTKSSIERRILNDYDRAMELF